MTERRMLDALQSIGRDARKLRDIASTKLSSKHVSSPHSSRSNLASIDTTAFMPQPPLPLVSEFLKTGVDAETAKRLSDAYLQAGSRLMTQTITRIHESASIYASSQEGNAIKRTKVVKLSSLACLSQYNRTLKAWADAGLALCRKRVLELRQTRGTGISTCSQTFERPTFNQSALPILVDSFTENPFPSREEKQQLACKTGMSYRQVHVWFQNHRSRSKKIDRESRSSSLSDGIREDIGPSEDEPDSEALEEAINVGSRETLTPRKHILCDIPRPLHAYPATYPPLSSCKPFPTGDDAPAFLTPWLRRCSTRRRCTSPPTHPPASISDITKSLAKLALGEGSADDHHCRSCLLEHWQCHCVSSSHTDLKRYLSNKSQNSYQEMRRWDFATVVPRAPLSSLIPTVSMLPVLPNTVTVCARAHSSMHRPSSRIVPAGSLLQQETSPVSERVDASSSFRHSPSSSYNPSAIKLSLITPSRASSSTSVSEWLDSRTNTNTDLQSSLPVHSKRKMPSFPRRIPAKTCPTLKHTRSDTWDYLTRSNSRSISSISRISSSGSLSSTGSSSSSSSGPETPPSSPTLSPMQTNMKLAGVLSITPHCSSLSPDEAFARGLSSVEESL